MARRAAQLEQAQHAGAQQLGPRVRRHGARRQRRGQPKVGECGVRRGGGVLERGVLPRAHPLDQERRAAVERRGAQRM